MINGSMQGDLASIEEGYLKTTPIKQIKKEKHQSSTGLLKRVDDIEEAKNPLGQTQFSKLGARRQTYEESVAKTEAGFIDESIVINEEETQGSGLQGQTYSSLGGIEPNPDMKRSTHDQKFLSVTYEPKR